MMNKKLKQRLSETLDKALAPPRKRGHLDNLLEEYDDGSRLVPSTSKESEKIAAPEIISHPEQHLRIPNELLDKIFPTLMPSDQVVLLRLYRLTRGFHNDTIKVSMGKLANACHLSSRQVTTCIQRLEKRSLIEKVSVDWSCKNQAERGAIIKIRLPAVPRENFSAPEEIAAIKYINTNNTHTQTQAGVSVGSRFSAEECRHYAEHLKQTGQGIKNTGGYATKIFRSGEADSLIEAFINPPVPLNTSHCLACRGTGFIYIDHANPDRGVKPCRHDSLKANAR